MQNTGRRYLTYWVYRSNLGDCTNGGVSATAKRIYVLCPDGPCDEKDIPEELRFRAEKRGETYWAAIPLAQKDGFVGPMHGGNLAETSDSRGVAVLRIHDRWETAEQYDLLSR